MTYKKSKKLRGGASVKYGPINRRKLGKSYHGRTIVLGKIDLEESDFPPEWPAPREGGVRVRPDRIPYREYLGLNIININFPDRIKIIESQAFMNCPNLENVEFSENSNLEIIGSEAFSGCKRLEMIILPDSLREINYKAFFFCKELKMIILSHRLQNIGYNVFDKCKKLNVIMEGNPIMPRNIFKDILSLRRSVYILLRSTNGQNILVKTYIIVDNELTPLLMTDIIDDMILKQILIDNNEQFNGLTIRNIRIDIELGTWGLNHVSEIKQTYYSDYKVSDYNDINGIPSPYEIWTDVDITTLYQHVTIGYCSLNL